MAMSDAPTTTTTTNAVPFGALLMHLPPAARAAYHHERRRGRTEIEALTYGVILPEVVEAIMMGHAA